MKTLAMGAGHRLPSAHTHETLAPTLFAVATPALRPPAQPRHLFVDNVRFWSILSIVAVHGTGIFHALGDDKLRLVEILLTPLKFGTIGFFLISGFLIGRGTETSKPTAYLGRRLRKVFIPWLLWFFLYVSILLAADFIHHRLSFSWFIPLVRSVLFETVYTFLNTAFWFVPNLLLSLSLLMVFRRYLQHRWFGAILLAINLFYVVNIYRHWVPSSHTEAMLGFVFYLWLGTYACRHHLRFQQWITRTPMALLLCLAVLLALLCFRESRLIESFQLADSMNTLRLSNQFFSVAAVLVLYKLRSATWPAFIDVRDHTFGVYLIHLPLLAVVLKIIKSRPLHATALHLMHTRSGAVLLWLVVTLIIYFGALMLTKAIASHRSLQWLVGVDTRRSPAL